MFNEPAFKFALIISLLAHSAAIIGGPHMNLLSRNKNAVNPQIFYLKTAQSQQQKKLPQPIASQKSHLASPPKLLTPPSMKAPLINDNKGLLARKPDFTRPDIIASSSSKRIGLENVDPKEINKVNNPSYISYYQIIREKIRRCAYQNYMRADAGEVYLSFVISDQGQLDNLRVIEEKSAPNNYLRQIAFKSVNEAAPYPPLPKELEYPQLSFNVIISFEVE